MSKRHKIEKLNKALPALLMALGAVAAAPCAMADETKPATKPEATQEAKPAGDAKADAAAADKSAEAAKKKKRSANPCAGQ